MRFVIIPAAIRTAIHFKRLGISRILFAFYTDMAYFPPAMADIIMLILKDLGSSVSQ